MGPLVEGRCCWVCMEDDDGSIPESSWISPCRCSGTVGWAHQNCVMSWVRVRYDNGHPDALLCPNCHTPYKLSVYRPMSSLIRLQKSIRRIIVPSLGGAFCVATIAASLARLGQFQLQLLTARTYPPRWMIVTSPLSFGKSLAFDAPVFLAAGASMVVFEAWPAACSLLGNSAHRWRGTIGNPFTLVHTIVEASTYQVGYAFVSDVLISRAILMCYGETLEGLETFEEEDDDEDLYIRACWELGEGICTAILVPLLSMAIDQAFGMTRRLSINRMHTRCLIGSVILWAKEALKLNMRLMQKRVAQTGILLPYQQEAPDE